MSMVSDLLFGTVPILPNGTITAHNTGVSDAREAFKESQRTTQAQNHEAVRQAISDGHCVNTTIREATGLAKATVFNACQMLLKADRITVETSRRPHCFYVKER